MLTIGFTISADQDHDDSIKFDLICTDVPAGMERDIEFELVGTNMNLTPDKVALRDVFDPATRGALVKIKGDFTAYGEAVAEMKASYKGQSLGGVKRSFDV